MRSAAPWGHLPRHPNRSCTRPFVVRCPPRADVENLLLYNIGAAHLKHASQYGLRFEHFPGPPHGGARFSYRYELEDRHLEFSHWRPSRQLASWDWTDIGPLASDRKVEQIWRALHRTPTDVNTSARAPDTPFCVRVKIRPAIRRPAAPATIIKSFLDGIICAFQAHTDTTTAADIAARLSKTMSTPIDQRSARCCSTPAALCLASCRSWPTPAGRESSGRRQTPIGEPPNFSSSPGPPTSGRSAARSMKSSPPCSRGPDARRTRPADPNPSPVRRPNLGRARRTTAALVAGALERAVIARSRCGVSGIVSSLRPGRRGVGQLAVLYRWAGGVWSFAPVGQAIAWRP